MLRSRHAGKFETRSSLASNLSVCPMKPTLSCLHSPECESGVHTECNGFSVLIKECSALAFTLDGLVKDAFIVMCGTTLLGKTVVYQQHVAFFECLACVRFGSYSKINPHTSIMQLFQKSVSRILRK